MAVYFLLGSVYLATIAGAVYLGVNGHPVLAVIVLLAGLSVSSKKRGSTK